MFDITGKVALITGSASGIGLAVGKALLDHGLRGLVLADINDTNGNKALKSIKEQYGKNRAIFVKVDVTDRKLFEDAFKTTVAKFGNVDILVNCAGIINERNWENEIATNLTGTITGTVLAVENFLLNSRTGSEAVVLNMSSIFGIRNYSCAPIFTASKHGVVGLTKSFGTKIHYDRTRIRVMVICPGPTDTLAFSDPGVWYLTEVYNEIGAIEFANSYPQKVSSVVRAMVQMIINGKNGSVWVVEDDRAPYEFISTTN